MIDIAAPGLYGATSFSQIILFEKIIDNEVSLQRENYYRMKTGKILWLDLTVDNAETVKDFYEQVAGWTANGMSMGDYEDYVMMSNDEPVAGICHNKGANKNLPSQWLNYITVENLDASIEKCIALGGRVVDGPRHAQGASSFAVIQDPGGAYVALMEQTEEE